MQSRGKLQATDAPISIYEVHPGSWLNRRLAYAGTLWDFTDRAARSLPRRNGLHACRASADYRASVRRLVGLSVIEPVCTERHVTGQPQGLARFVEALHAAGLGIILDWVPAHFPDRPARTGALRRHRAIRASRSARRLSPRLEHLHLQFRPARGARLPDRQRTVLARDFHIDGLRVDAVASMLYRDYSRDKANGSRISTAAARISRPSVFCAISTPWLPNAAQAR